MNKNHHIHKNLINNLQENNFKYQQYKNRKTESLLNN